MLEEMKKEKKKIEVCLSQCDSRQAHFIVGATDSPSAVKCWQEVCLHKDKRQKKQS